MVAINLNISESLENVKEFVKNSGVSFPVLIDENQKVKKMFNARGTPYILLFNKKGEILTRGWELPFEEIETLMKF